MSLTTAEIELQDLSSFVASDWSVYSLQGFYVHRGRAHLCGIAQPLPPAGTTILSGLPVEVRPASDTAVTLTAPTWRADDPATPGISVPITVAATITTAGDLVLGAVPTYVNETPDPAIYQHLTTEDGSTFVADFTHPLGYALVLDGASWLLPDAVDDAYTAASFGPFLAGAFEDIDSMIAVHDARVHLSGRVRAAVDNPLMLCDGLPPDYTRMLGDSAYTVIDCPDGRLALEISGDGGMTVASDQKKDTGDPGAWRVRYRPADGEYVGLSWQGFHGQNRRVIAGDDALGWDPLAIPGFHAIRQEWDAGGYVAAGGDFCLAPAGPQGLVATSEQVTGLLAQWVPQPDWVMLAVDAHFNFRMCNDGPPPEFGCPPLADPGELSLIFGGIAVEYCDGFSGTTLPSNLFPGFVNADTRIQGVLKRTDGAGYEGNPSNPAAKALLFRPDELGGFTAGISGSTNTGTITIQVTMWPLWEERRRGIKKGDVVDLVGAGWPGRSALIPGVMVPGPGSIGTLPLTGLNISGR